MRAPAFALRRSLLALADVTASLDGAHYRNMYDFVLREGTMFTPAPLPAGVPQAIPRHCFHNSIMLSVVRGLPYVEGFAINPAIGMPVQHAWNLDDRGRVIDCTWNDRLVPPSARAYMGVRFSARRADDCTWEGDASVLDDYHRGYRVLRECWTPEESPGDTSGLLELIVERYIEHDGLDPADKPAMIAELARQWSSPRLQFGASQQNRSTA